MQVDRNGDSGNRVAGNNASGGNRPAPQTHNRILTAKEVLALIEKNNRNLAMNRDYINICTEPGIQEIRAQKAKELLSTDFGEKLTRNIDDFYRFGKTLGEGAFAKVIEAQHKMTGWKVAVKCIKVRDATHPNERKDALREAATLKLLQHSNIVCFIDVFQSATHVYIVQELLQLSLKEYLIRNGGKLSERESAFILQQLAVGLNHIHYLGFMHFDIKVRNVLISLDDKKKVCGVKIADFGLTTNKIGNLKGGQDV